MNQFYDYEGTLTQEKKKRLGIVYTPMSVVRYINEELLSKWEGVAPPKILDPCCGTGVFLHDMAQRISLRWGIPLKEVYKNYIYGFDLDKEAVSICKDNIPGSNIEIANSLEVDFGLCDIIVTNPPYVRIQNLDEKTRYNIQKNYKFCSGYTDIYIAFFEKLALCGKIVGMICPNSWTRNKSSHNLRSFLFKKRNMYKLVDFKDTSVFKNVDVYPSIVFLNNEKNDKLFYSNNMSMNSISIDYDLSDDNSIFVGLESPYNNGIELLELCDIKIGLATLADSVFYGRVLEETQDGFCLFETKKSAPVLVEKGSLRPCIKASKHQKIEKNTFIIFPYGSDKRLLSESEFSVSFPRAYNYLSSKKERLLARDKGKIDPSKWYAYGRTQGLLNDNEKILIAPFQKDKMRYRYSKEGEFYISGYSIMPKSGITFSQIEQFLSQPELWSWLESRGKNLSSGWVGISKQTFMNYKIPTNEKD